LCQEKVRSQKNEKNIRDDLNDNDVHQTDVNADRFKLFKKRRDIKNFPYPATPKSFLSFHKNFVAPLRTAVRLEKVFNTLDTLAKRTIDVSNHLPKYFRLDL